MQVQIVKFHLEGISEADYLAACSQLAPAIAEAPGLISKTFLADRATNTYGGVYFWRDAGSLDAFKRSDIWHAIANHPNLAGITIEEFGTLDEPSRVTRGLLAVAS
jgi:heme-degrading monooxygenase HmoA